MKKGLIFGSIFILLFACKKSENDVSEPYLGYAYLPLQTGQESIFQVDSIIYDDFTNTVDSISFQRREKVSSSYVDGAGRKAYRVEISHRSADTVAWKIQKVISRLLTDRIYEQMIDNLINIPLVFPPAENKQWNGNALNTLDEQEYVFKAVHHPFNLDEHSYDSTLKVIQRDEENLIERLYTEEMYASGFGLIYRKDI